MIVILAGLAPLMGSCATATPVRVAGLPPASLSDRFVLQADEVGLEYIAHACFRVHSPEGQRILLDPFASRVWIGYDFPEGIQADGVIITHPHYDHDGGEFMGRPVTWPSAATVIRDPGDYVMGDVKVHGIPGKHAGPYGKEFGQKNTMFVVEVAGVRILHLGDNGPLSPQNIEALGRVDVLLIPIDGEEHLLKNAEVEAIRAGLRPRVLVPMHYRLPDLETQADRPKDLGPIDPWLVGQSHVTRLNGSRMVLRASALQDTPQIVVFRHALTGSSRPINSE